MYIVQYLKLGYQNKHLESMNGPEMHALEVILPFLRGYGFVSRDCTIHEIKDTDIKELCIKWNIKLQHPRKKTYYPLAKILEELCDVGNKINKMKEQKEREREQERQALLAEAQEEIAENEAKIAAGEDIEEKSVASILSEKTSAAEFDFTSDVNAHIKAKFGFNFFGAAVENQSALSLTYASRQQVVPNKKKKNHHDDDDDARAQPQTMAVIQDIVVETKVAETKNSTAQKKVAHALLIMASNGKTIGHFVNKGGIEAVYKMLHGTEDEEVLSVCSACLVEVTAKGVDHGPTLVDKSIISNILTLIEKGSEHVKFQCARAIANLSFMPHDNFAAKLVRAGINAAAHALMTSARIDTVSYAALTTCNVAPEIASGPDAESAARLCINVSKRLEMLKDIDAGKFVSMLHNNLARIPIYSVVLVEEGVVPIFMSMIQALDEKEIIEACVEGFVNLSTNQKNKREISSSGISNHLSKILTMKDSPLCRSYALLMVGNLLSSGFLHDKIARSDVIIAILNMMVPKIPKQFVAVSFCLCQICLTPPSAKMVVECGVIPKAVGLLDSVQSAVTDSDGQPIKGTGVRDGVAYLWTLLINLSNEPDYIGLMFFGSVSETFVESLLRECYSDLPYAHDVTGTGPVNRKEEAIQIMLNLTTQENVSELLTDDQAKELAVGCKNLLLDELMSRELRLKVLTVMVNFGTMFTASRQPMLGNDLIRVINELGTEDKEMNFEFVQLLALISRESNCCVKLLDSGTQVLLVGMHNTFDSKGVDLSAAILHNMSFKRSVMATGMLSTLQNMLRGCKTARALWVVRCIANLSATLKTRTALAKERKLITILTVLMRSGGDEAERVQHYCAYAICNILSTFMDRGILEELMKSGTIGDLMVVTLLRVNSKVTKESLGKALFNLLARQDFRSRMVDVGIMDALIELGKQELLELLELSARTLYNMSCEVPSNPQYAEKMGHIGAPSLLIGRITSSPSLQGVKPTKNIKTLCGMAMTNFSFNAQLATDLSCDKNFPAALEALNFLMTEEASYCIATTAFNISYLPTLDRLASTNVITTLVSVVERGPVLCSQLAIATLCNMSLQEPFFEQLSKEAIAPLSIVLGTPTIAFPIKLDCLHFIYNLVTKHQAARPFAIEAEVIPALWKLVKTQNDNDLLMWIGRILMELCSEAEGYIKKLIQDGIMPILLKLAKIELAPLKVDLARAIYFLTIPFSEHTMKVLKYDGVDIIFWLTLHDCLKVYDYIKQNCVRALLNMTCTPDEAMSLAKEDRFITIMKELARSTDEDVLWQAAACVFNLMNNEEIRPTMVERGVVSLIFDIAACKIPAVEHVCSACLHMVPDDMPDMEDPAVLHLVMCLLDADGEMFAGLNRRAVDPLKYTWGENLEGTNFETPGTDFVGHWVSLTCEVDKHFYPAGLDMPVRGFNTVSVKPLANSSMEFPPHELLKPSSFNEFESNPRKESSQIMTIGNGNGTGKLSAEYLDADTLEHSEDPNDITMNMTHINQGNDNNGMYTTAPSPYGNTITAPVLNPVAPASNDPEFQAALSGFGAIGIGMNDSIDSPSAQRGNYIAGFDANDKVIPETVENIVFPRIQNKNNRTPNDTLKAIKGNLYYPTGGEKSDRDERKKNMY